MIPNSTNKTLKLNTSNSNILWGSDFHFGHDPIHWDVPLWKMRGWDSVEESNESIINNVNARFESFNNFKLNILILLGDVYIPSRKEGRREGLGSITN